MDDLKAFRVPVLILSGGEPAARTSTISPGGPRLRVLRRAVVERHADRRAQHRPHRRCDFNYVGVSLDGIRDETRQVPPPGRRLRGVAEGHPPVPRSRPEDRRPFHDDAGQRPRPARPAEAGRGRGHRPLLLLPPQLRRARQQEPRDDAQHQLTRLGDGPALRHLLGLSTSAGWTRNSPPATTTPTASISCTGSAAASRQGGHVEASCASGAATRPASMSPTSTIRQRPPGHHVVASHAQQRQGAPFSQIWPDLRTR